MMMEGFGLNAIVVEDLAAASRAFGKNIAPDLLISDYRLRDGSTGVEAALTLRKQFGRSLPVLIITGDTSPESLRDVESHQLEIMYKLSNEEELEAKIRSLL
jgi:two-component system, sensor histidine kinase